MPTMEHIGELFDNCTSEWTTLNGVNGYKFTGPNGNSIFLPAAGYRWEDSLYGIGISTFNENDVETVNQIFSNDPSSKTSKGIHPGSDGELKFWVVSKGSRTINITFKIEIVPYRTDYVVDENGNYVFSPGSEQVAVFVTSPLSHL